VVVEEEHQCITSSQIDALQSVPNYSLLLEPLDHDTAPAVCAAVEFCALTEDDNTILLILPVDHLILRQEAFAAAVKKAADLAADGFIATFGIEPQSPETGYGYIERGQDHAVLSFKEKPDLATALSYVENGNYFWNSGMLAFSIRTFREEMGKHAPEMLAIMSEAVRHGVQEGKFYHLDKKAMAASPSDSIDYALMEKTDKAAVVAADLDWSDIGSWKALWDLSPKDARGNVSSGDVILEDTDNCLIRAENKLVATVGLEDTLVVETADAVLVAPLSRSQDVKKVVARLKKKQRDEFKFHRTVLCPWGSYTILARQPGYLIKQITIYPGKKLSLQMHRHHHAHWLIVSGTARITNDDQVFLLRENQSTSIRGGSNFRLENPGEIALKLIEIQNSSYSGEDVNIRFDETYREKGRGKQRKKKNKQIED
jgi:mannose-1-phosphate guanylyltransferase/mannose-6-phosphate isomerase